MEELDERVVRFLVAQGWWPERRVPKDLARWNREFFQPQGFELCTPAHELLLTLGGMKFENDGPGESVARDGFHFDPTEAWGELDRFQDFERVIGARLCPVGEGSGRRTYLAVTEDGRMLEVMDDAWIIGSSIYEGLASLVLGRLGQVVYAYC